MALFTCIGEFPLIALCGRKQDVFQGDDVAAFISRYFFIFLNNPVLRNLYPLLCFWYNGNRAFRNLKNPA
jgi:bacitracin transport system permease protein